MSGQDLNRRFVRRTTLSMLGLGQATVVILLFVLHLMNITLAGEDGGCGGIDDPAGDLMAAFLVLEALALLLPVLALMTGAVLARREKPLGRAGAVCLSIGLVVAVRLIGVVLLAHGLVDNVLPALAFSLIFTLGLPEIVAGGLAYFRHERVFGGQ